MGVGTRQLNFGAAFACAVLLTGSAMAQIATDGTVGERRTLTGQVVQIPDSLGQRNGPNLLHSFDRFNVRGGNDRQVVQFGVPGGVDRVIGRVTGTGPSRIDGIVSFRDSSNLLIPVNADFFFFNPNGILIGPEAQFRTGGALYFSGGDGLRFSDGGTIFADPDARLTLTSAAPEAFGFFNRDPGPVTFTPPPPTEEDPSPSREPLPLQGSGIHISGGTITIDNGTLEADDIGGLNAGAAESIVLVTGVQGDLAPIRGDDVTGPATGGTVRLLGAGDGKRNLDSTAGGGIVVKGGTVSIEGGAIRAEALTAKGGSIRIIANDLSLTDRGAIGTLASGTNDAGAIDVTARNISILGGSGIRSQTIGAGDAGPIDVNGFDRLLISRDGTGLPTLIASDVLNNETVVGDRTVLTIATGNADAVTITGGALVLEDGGRIFSTTLGAGDAGSVSLRLTSLDATGGAQVGSGVVDDDGQPGTATGNGGDLELIATERISFSGILPETANDPEPEPSGLFSSTEGTASGSGGDLFASAPLILLDNEAEIGAETFGNAPAGNVTLEGDTLIARNGAEITTTSRTGGIAGEVNITLTGSLLVDQGAELASRALGDGGVAGRIVVNAGDIRIANGAEVTTASNSSDGGAITLTSTGRTVIDSASVTTSVGSSDGNGGTISVDGDSLILLNESTIASTALLGSGGEVVVGSAFSFIEPTSAIDVSSAFGTDGIVRILGTIGDQTSESETPPAAFFNRFALIDDFCVAAVTGGSALRLVGPQGRPFDAATTPALFGTAIPYPETAGTAGQAASPLVLAKSVISSCQDPS
ncbi:MAG: filamentous hemagglutinin N-terminal domain-containing protein [Pseudomonadota bacterium]